MVVSSEVWDLVKNFCKGEPKENDFHVTEILEPIEIRSSKKLEKIPLDIETAVRCYIQKNVQIKIDSLQVSWLAELREITTLFVKLSGLSYRSEESLNLNLINDVLCTMQEVVFKFEGMVRQFLVDDKGTGKIKILKRLFSKISKIKQFLLLVLVFLLINISMTQVK